MKRSEVWFGSVSSEEQESGFASTRASWCCACALQASSLWRFLLPIIHSSNQLWRQSHFSSPCRTVFISADIFDLVLVFILRRKCLIVSFESFIVLVDGKSLHFSQLVVTNIYFGSYFICSIQTKIVINASLFTPNQLSLWEIWIKDWIWIVFW